MFLERKSMRTFQYFALMETNKCKGKSNPEKKRGSVPVLELNWQWASTTGPEAASKQIPEHRKMVPLRPEDKSIPLSVSHLHKISHSRVTRTRDENSVSSENMHAKPRLFEFSSYKLKKKKYIVVLQYRMNLPSVESPSQKWLLVVNIFDIVFFYTLSVAPGSLVKEGRGLEVIQFVPFTITWV